ncbi:MAG: hypothetical protein QXQ79_01560 [Candidatus Nanoarchaeia archaeon]
MDIKKTFENLFKKEKHGYEAHPTLLGKIWHFLCHEESWASLLADILLLIIILKFMFFPILGFLLHTDLPLVAVVSGSMDHKNENFEVWWENHKAEYLEKNISKEQFQNFPFKDGFKKGDVFVIVGYKNKKPEVGDVIVYKINKNYPVIHRVILVKNGVVETKGDANLQQFEFEKVILLEQISGKAIFKIPY